MVVGRKTVIISVMSSGISPPDEWLAIATGELNCRDDGDGAR
jgi:hypothetical protein